jgi:hypothetical protein
MMQKQGKPSVAVLCEEFEQHGRTMATVLGYPDLPMLILPYPLEARPAEELERIATEFYPKLMEVLGAVREAARP